MTLPSKYYYAIIVSPDLAGRDMTTKTWAVWSLDPIDAQDPAFGEDDIVAVVGEDRDETQSLNGLYQDLVDMHEIEELRPLAEVRQER